MRTFLDKAPLKTHTFVIYGNLNDSIWGPDLQPRDFEFYLVNLLKSRGYKYVILFNSSGTRGAYCLDPESARFFFGENEGIPEPGCLKLSNSTSHVEENAEKRKSNKGSANGSGARVSDAMADFFNTRTNSSDYVPGDFSMRNETSREQESSSTDYQAGTAINSGKVRYGYKNYLFANFIELIKVKMRNEEQPFAFVFDNTLTTNEISNNELKDLISKQLEKPRNKNVCFLLFPESSSENLTSVFRGLQGYESQFLLGTGHGDQYPDPEKCIKIGRPEQDEISYMLRYLSIVGTRKGNKIRFSYNELDYMAEGILQSSEVMKMKDFYDTMEKYIDDNHTSGNPLTIDTEGVRSIFGVVADDKVAIEKLSVPGWENAYAKVKGVLKALEKDKKKSKPAPTVSADMGVMRLKAVDEENNRNVPLPHFVILGNRGVGKTTVARIITEVLYENGYIKNRYPVEMDFQKLSGIHVSESAQRTKTAIDNAQDGVLFIDEIHALKKKESNSVDDGVAGQIINTLTGAMTRPEHRFSLILGGYDNDETKKLWDENSGFKSRFKDNFIYLEDFPPELLTQILIGMLKKKDYQLDSSLTDAVGENGTHYSPIQCLVEHIYRVRDDKFGNGRAMETIVNKIDQNVDGQVLEKGDFLFELEGHEIKEDWFYPTTNDMQNIDDLIGLEGVKREVRSQINTLEMNQKRMAQHLSPIDVSKHLVFTGNPGTGKTTVARIIAQKYQELGILKRGQLIEVSRPDLVAGFVGQTALKTQAVIEEAKGGILFIDEAYQLSQHGQIGNDFGSEAIGTLLKAMEDDRSEFAVIVAGYPKEMEQFMESNPGLASRFKKTIQFEDYNQTELFSILHKFCEDAQMTLSDDAKDVIHQYLESLILNKSDNFGNGREMRNLYENIMECKANNISNLANTTYEELTTIRIEDIPDYVKKDSEASI